MADARYFVLDTNVFINNPTVFLEFEKNDIIVIPYQVILELEKHKFLIGETGAVARKSSRQLMAIVESHKESTLKQGIELDNGSILKIISAKKEYAKIYKDIKVPGSSRNGDDCILAICIGLKEDGHNVTLVSEDMLLKIRANTFDVPIKSFKKNDSVTAIQELHPGFYEIKIHDEELEANFWQEHGQGEEFFSGKIKDLVPKTLFSQLNANDFLSIESAGEPKKKPYGLLKIEEHGKTLRGKFIYEQKSLKLRPLNREQLMAMDLLFDSKIQLVSLLGQAGTGKTILALEAGLQQILSSGTYKSMVIIRPIHSVGKEMGYLPGTKAEKLEPWIAPIKDNLRYLMADDKKSRRGEKLDYYFEHGIIEIEAMAYLRGRSINDAFIILDEAQNCDKHELKTFLTRVGHGTKVILTGDIDQIDRTDINTYTNGLSVAVEKFKTYPISAHITLQEGVRSPLSALAAKIL